MEEHASIARTGEILGCWYLSMPAGPHTNVVEACWPLFSKRVAWVTSVDSGPMALSAAELASGWIRDGDVAISPPLGKPDELPLPEEYSEYWFDVQTPEAIAGIDRFVNYGGFSIAATAGRDEPSDPLQELRRWFWIAFWQSGASLYLSEGDYLNFACRERAELNQILAAIKSPS